MSIIFFICMLWASIVITLMTLNTGINFFYGTKQVFVTFAPEGDVGPLGDDADEYAESHFKRSVIRRLYAIEVWLSNAVAAVGAAVTPFMWLATYYSWMAI